MKLRYGFSEFNRLKAAFQATEVSLSVLQETALHLQQPFLPSIPSERQERAQVQNLFYSHLISTNKLTLLLSSLFDTRKHLVTIPTSKLLKSYFLAQEAFLAQYQKHFLSYYFSVLRDISFFEKVTRPEELNALILYNYACLINNKEDLVDKDTMKELSHNHGSFDREITQLRSFFNYPIQPFNSSSYHKRSKIQEEVQLILRNLKIPFLRQQNIACYRVDYLIGDTVVEVLGPSHYIPNSRILRGEQTVREKILTQRYKFLKVEHFVWSKLKGLQEQREFVKGMLRNSKY